MPTRTNTLTTKSMDARMIAAMRFLLVLSVLLILFIDPPESKRNVAFLYIALVLYTLHSATLYVLALLRRPPSRPGLFTGWTWAGN